MHELSLVKCLALDVPLIKYQTVSLEIVKRFVLQAPTHSFMSGCFIWAAHYLLIT